MNKNDQVLYNKCKRDEKSFAYLRSVPENSIGFCEITAIRDRKSESLIDDVSTPSIKISPPTEAKRNKAPINDDLPVNKQVN